MSDPTDDHGEDVPEQIRVRREKRQRMLDRGDEPYPVSVPRTRSLAQIRAAYDDAGLEPDTRTGDVVAVAGRVIHLRNTGKLCFVRLREGAGTELQVMLSLDAVGQESLDDFKALVDLGDHIAVQGEVVTSRRGELSVAATAWQMAAKTLRPLPVEHKPLSDEARVRLRYADLIVRPEARAMVRTRARVLGSFRSTLERHDFVEVETPVLHHRHGGAARPFRTHLHVFDEPMTLRTNLELYLKRAVVGGVDRVYEMGRNFRNEGLDSTHHAEFTMLECYQAYGDYDTMAELTRELIVDAATETGNLVVPDGHGGEIDLSADWSHVTIHGVVSEAVGEEITAATEMDALRSVADRHGVALQPDWDAGEIVVELFEQLVEGHMTAPTFVRDYPESVRPLARPHREIPGLVEAWDLVIAGVETGTAYSELVDPVIQRRRLEEQAGLASAGDEDAIEMDLDFLRALEYGMPPSGGMGMGVDRVLRLFTGAGIRETILFPLVRPE